jgi:NhaP-type Na+/H+ or K+/H+ antiporter
MPSVIFVVEASAFYFLDGGFMLFSLSLIFLCGLTLGGIFSRLKMPSLIGMVLTGIILGPFSLNLLDKSILDISGDLRQLALIIILTKVGLSIDVKDLIKVDRPAILICFVPACFEIIGMVIIAPRLLGVSLLDAAIMGSVVAAVSPAVIVPRMLKLMKNGYGKNNSIPQLIMAGASVDDIFVIILFTSFIGLAKGESFSVVSLLQIPISIILGVLTGLIIGILLSLVFSKIHVRDSSKIIIILSISFLLITLEHYLNGVVGFSGLLGVMSVGISLQKKSFELSQRLTQKFSKAWVGAEILLFVLVGATLNIKYAFVSVTSATLVVLCVIIFRIFGVYLSLIKTKLSIKEKAFCMLAYTPKATVQAAIGSIPLSMGLASGDMILTVSVLSILITAPIGAFLIDNTYKNLLIKSKH